jgi:MarR family transcriptional regulator, negative regulator of the multidrug operon emrRAB
MPHAHETAREANLLGAASIAVCDRLRQAAEAGAGRGGSAPAALISLAGYLDGGPIDSLRDPLALTHSAAVRVVDRLVAEGLAQRRPGRDGRSVAVELTAGGRRAAADALSAREAVLEDALEALSPAERAQLTHLHEKLLAGLTDNRAAARNICRLCDLHACGHNEGRCPVTKAADAVS